MDQESVDLFTNNGLSTSSTNIWSVGITTGVEAKYSYQLERINRNFRVEFDVTKPIETPPPAWGDEDIGKK